MDYAKHYAYQAKYRLVWTTYKNQKIFVNAKLKDLLTSCLKRLASNNRIELMFVNVSSTVVDLEVSFPSSKSVATVVKILKGGSSKFMLKSDLKIKQQYQHVWSSSYYFSTLGDKSLSDVDKFVNDNRYN